MRGDVDDITHLISDWPVQNAAVGVTTDEATIAVGGDVTWVTRIASVAKLLVGVSALVALEEETIALDEPAGPEGATVEHLLAHASGMAFDSDRMLSVPGRRRIYSNTGIEVFASHLERRAEMDFGDYLGSGVLEPLGMRSTALAGSPAHDVWSNVEDLLALARELLRPTLVTPETLADATRPHFPDLAGVLPGIGSFDPNPWGLTFEIRAGKRPHWTGEYNTPSTFGHFGGSGTFLWVDPEAGLAAVALTDREFDEWALEVWPPFSDAVLDRYA
ncbi:MAG TPA: serine hydrolase domain-containing protein [Acidimicrobiia bacterium]|nr:serine hydrolase domain-containing protein [Acidimicrobiia bacterium]